MSSAPLSWKNSVPSNEHAKSVNESTAGSVIPKWITFFVVAMLGTTLDLWTKSAIFAWLGLPGENSPWWLIEPYVGIETAVNPGALFGLGAGFGFVFAILSVAAAVGIFVWLAKFRAIESWWLTSALSFVLGGIGGNLYDRLGLWNPPEARPEWASGVRDWILFQYNDQWVWPNFNIADSLLVCGAIMLFLHTLFTKPTVDQAKQES